MWVGRYPAGSRPAIALHHSARYLHIFRYSDLEVLYAAHCFIAERLNLEGMAHPPGLGESGWYMECRLAQLDETRWLRGLRKVELGSGQQVIMSKQVLAARRALTGLPYPEVQEPVFVPPELLGLWRSGRFPEVPSPPYTQSPASNESYDSGGLLLGASSCQSTGLASVQAHLGPDLEVGVGRPLPGRELPPPPPFDARVGAFNRAPISSAGRLREDRRG